MRKAVMGHETKYGMVGWLFFVRQTGWSWALNSQARNLYSVGA